MRSQITMLSDIRAGKIDWKIRVRVIHMWKNVDRNNRQLTKSIEMILLDEKSSKIQASVKQNLFNTFENILEVGSCYVIQNLLVALNDPKFKSTSHNFKLAFMRNTMCMKIDDGSIPQNVFKFVSFPEILSVLNETYLIDVIGHVVQRGDLRENEKNGIKNNIMDIVLEDLQGNRMDATLWGNFAKELDKYFTDRDPNAKLGVSTSFDSTRLIINGSFVEVTEYKDRLEASNTSLTQVVSHVSGQSGLSLNDEFLLTPMMSCAQVIEANKANVVVVLAKIVDFDTSKPWYYDGCPKCAKKLTTKVGRLFYCDKCSTMCQAVKRCKIQAQVIDLSGSADFTLFERLATQYLDEPMTKLMESHDPYSWPKAFDSLLGKEMLFKIQISKENIENTYQTYTVKKVSDEVSLIEEFKKLHGIKDEGDSDLQNIESAKVGDNMKVSINNEDSVKKSDQSANAEDQIIDVEDTTPNSEKSRKRLVDEVDCASPKDGTGTENSTTKMPKFVDVKKEPTE